jgi:hypothetical protein
MVEYVAVVNDIFKNKSKRARCAASEAADVDFLGSVPKLFNISVVSDRVIHSRLFEKEKDRSSALGNSWRDNEKYIGLARKASKKRRDTPLCLELGPLLIFGWWMIWALGPQPTNTKMHALASLRVAMAGALLGGAR